MIRGEDVRWRDQLLQAAHARLLKTRGRASVKDGCGARRNRRKEALKRSGVNPEDVDEVIMGSVLQGGQGQLPSRQAARFAGLPWDVKTETINKVCASGLRSVTMADQIIRAGDAEVIAAGGMESMSNAPYLLQKRGGG